jgi:hypothetical protein
MHKVLSMKCWNSSFNAQGLRVIIVVVQVRAVEALGKKERQDETHSMEKGHWQNEMFLTWVEENFCL